ncbi:hypothetical protein KY329_01980 [Candidatus Woesearchaeota archaeon]|nr:hypothetical protein [Candidatus Woesearchaeota archaeon]
MKSKIILAVIALAVLVGLISCMPPCPPGTELSPDGVCIEAGATPEPTAEPAQVEEKKPELKKTSDLAEQLAEKPAEEPAEKPAEQLVEEPENVGEPEQTPETEVELNSASEIARQRLKEFNEIYHTKVKSYEFTDPGIGTYKVKGNMMKLVLLSPRLKRSVKYGNMTIPLFYYDAIYHNFETGETTGYCEGLNSDLRKSCQQAGIENIPLPLKEPEVEDVIYWLPHNWLDDLFKNSVPKMLGEGRYYVHDRAVSRIDFQEPDGFVYFDPLNGLPIRLELMHDGMKQVIDFKGLVIDTVKDKEMRNRPYDELGFDERLD